ncbi:carboxypeptidase-like regulatory domain-containing protein [Gilvimarinus agarilyticus]|uniref:alpha-2-macroglobulin family protein n=1 Tax=Reichenbachiella agariperforans TaxID=156994 RepID=UPI001C097581|nr:alpha-2-macroglobulin family protein [Reichenbachiella agariperforans]MBU2886352.1 carboxypeptidase-like regulatory domain-containing protein [Gilvimarinus agarilyticus]MBU2913292.1 carboxypeptidase-like regulatory domain-containing protein [Reichenbachiella agariperforans]
MNIKRANHLKTLLILIISWSGYTAVQAQSIDQAYFDLWKQVYQAELKGLPSSAAVWVDSIYTLSVAANNPAQQVKATLYQCKFMLLLDEQGQDELFMKMKQAIQETEGVQQALLHSYMAEYYNEYLRNNRWSMSDRVETDVLSEDYHIWTIARMHQVIQEHHRAALSHRARLQETPMSALSMFVDEEENAEILRPSAYDFIAQRAITCYLQDDYYLPSAWRKLTSISGRVFDQSIANSAPEDHQTMPYKALQLMEELGAYHLQRDQIGAYLDVALQRLTVLYDQTKEENNRTEEFLEKLQSLRQQYQDSEFVTLIDYRLAKWYFDQGTNYHTKGQYPEAFRTARTICQQAVQDYPESIGARQCGPLLNKIDALSLSVQTEEYLPIDRKSKVAVSYTNIDSLRLRIYAVDQDFPFEISGMSTQLVWDKLVNRKVLHEESFALINDLDFREHSTELPLPQLKGGYYLLWVETQGDTLRKSMAYGHVQVTDLSLVRLNDNRFQVVNRLTGAPASGATVEVTPQATSESKSMRLSTDDQGIFVAKSFGKDYQFHFEVSYQADTAHFDQVYISEQYQTTNDGEQELIVRPVLMTDRSIYRPGQTIYFKGVLLKQKGEKKELVQNEWVDVYLEDINYEEVGEYLTLKTNEYGSFSGEIVLPIGCSLGEYTLYVEDGIDADSKLYDEQMDDFEYIEYTISVEEYKRPRFKVNLDQLDSSYVIGDSITVDGVATAFAGSPISDARVDYRVSRQLKHPGWWGHSYDYQSTGSSEVVATGSSQTDAKGQFSLSFLAQMDEDRDKLPIASYQINVDVIDINGETRSATRTVQCGYHQHLVSILSNARYDRSNDQNYLRMHVTDLNEQAKEAMVSLRVYKEQLPNQVLRPAPRAIPDRPIMDSLTFVKWYPYDLYSTFDRSQKGELMYSTTLQTAQSDTVKFGDMSTWETGSYLIEAEVKEASGLLVRDIQRMTVFDEASHQVSDYQLFTIDLDQKNYEAGEEVSVTLGTAAEDMTVSLHLKVGNQVQEPILVPLHDEIKTVKIRLPKSLEGSVDLYYTYAFHNSFESGNVAIPIQTKIPTKLDIRTESFRDRLVPGAEETWSFSISGVNGEKANAELLASMYDVSLDEFQPHTWRFFSESQPYRYHGYFYIHSPGFNTNYLRSNNLVRQVYVPYYQRYQELKTFGLSLRNPQNAQKRYLESIKAYEQTATNDLKVQYDSTLEKGIIHGLVTGESNETIPGATIVIVGTNKGTVTDMEGVFELAVKKGQTIQVSFIGYLHQQVEIGEFNRMEVSLVPDVSRLEEVVVVGYSSVAKQSLTGSVAGVEVTEEIVIEDIVFSEAPEEEIDGATDLMFDLTRIQIRGASSLSGSANPLYIVDGVMMDQMQLSPEDILSMDVLQGDAATSLYGARAANGIILITTQSGQDKLAEEMAQVKVRTNLKETAFFYPHITANRKGEYKVVFTSPESLTQWKLQLLAHDKKLRHGLRTLRAITQKDLMVIPNPPRFLRTGDEITLQSKIVNRTTQPMEGKASLLLIDPVSGSAVDQPFGNTVRTQPFVMGPNESIVVSWTILVPKDVDVVQYKIVAKTDEFSDGESDVLPVLSNRQLITETLPVWVNGHESRSFELTALKNTTSTTLQHHQLSFELTEDPVWFAIQSLPYLMEFPHECAEQTFARYYANELGAHILQTNPSVKAVFDEWKATGESISSLYQNNELKSILIEESPWLSDAQSEEEKHQRMASLFDGIKMEEASIQALDRLFDMQEHNGGFPWFGGGQTNRTITQHIVAGFGHLAAIGIPMHKEWNTSLSAAIGYLEDQLRRDYQLLQKQAGDRSDSVAHMRSAGVGFQQIQAMYARSFYDSINMEPNADKAYHYYLRQAAAQWLDYSLYKKAMLALVLYRDGQQVKALEMVESIAEFSTSSEEFGVYWKENVEGWNWYQSPIETQALLIELFETLMPEDERLIGMRLWLLRHKQTQSWPTTKATTDAIYALLLNQSTIRPEGSQVTVSIGGKVLDRREGITEQAAGHYEVKWSPDEMDQSMAQIELNNADSTTAWGAMYWQYFEDIDAVQSSTESWTIDKQVLLNQQTLKGTRLVALSDSVQLHVGDLLTVRLVVKIDRDAEFVHLKDQRASGLEPVDVLSGYQWQEGISYYQMTRDTGTHFFFDMLNKGTYVFSYELRVNHAGVYNGGIATIQSMYAPVYSGHSDSQKIEIQD